MSRNNAKKIVEKYAKELRKKKFPFKAVYLYGSYATDRAGKWSDIDVAVVSDKLKKNWDNNEFLLWKIGRLVDSRIEPIGFTSKNFSRVDPIAMEVKKSGIKIA